MLKKLKYRQLVFIHSSDTDGRALLGRFQTKITDLQSDDQEVKVRFTLHIFKYQISQPLKFNTALSRFIQVF